MAAHQSFSLLVKGVLDKRGLHVSAVLVLTCSYNLKTGFLTSSLVRGMLLKEQDGIIL